MTDWYNEPWRKRTREAKEILLKIIPKDKSVMSSAVLIGLAEDYVYHNDIMIHGDDIRGAYWSLVAEGSLKRVDNGVIFNELSR